MERLILLTVAGIILVLATTGCSRGMMLQVGYVPVTSMDNRQGLDARDSVYLDKEASYERTSGK